MTTTSTDNTYHQKIHIFSPVILFHDHVYVKEGTHHLEHVHISYKDPQYVSLIEKHKLKTKQMLDVNGKYWVDGLIDDTAMINSSFNQISISSSTSTSNQQNQNQISSSSPIPASTISLPLLTNSKSHTIINEDNQHHQHHQYLHNHYERRRRQSSLSSSSSTTTTATTAIDKKSNRKRRGNLPRAVTSVLREWLANHKQHPYPTDEEKLALAQQTHLTLNQVSNWFINARRRILITMLEEDKKTNSNNNQSDNNINNNSIKHSSRLIF
ncbi:hypothetical protein BJ944DRAFT_246136 [Cunninghamella echinulata]|nr:hypothetical protein BJ944DRAFT_246136 [Cunninghamella echinulata]